MNGDHLGNQVRTPDRDLGQAKLDMRRRVQYDVKSNFAGARDRLYP